MTATIRGIVHEAAPDLVVTDLSSMADFAAAYGIRQRFYGAVFGIFAAIAMGLAAVGIYGLISYTVIHRRREIAIRSVLGADGWDVLRQFVGQASLLTVLGVAVGATMSVGVTRLLRGLLFDVSPLDSMTILIAALVLASIAIVASVVPVMRARRMSLAAELRLE
jgi:putative ABC transport system permease protein